GEDHDPETHLIPLAIDAALGRRPELAVFGTDYPTPDGSCIRDYVHVTDLADAHIRVLARLDCRSVRYHLGTGKGHSGREVVNAVERVSGRKIPVRKADRRAGDPAMLVASPGLFIRDTGWDPRFGALDQLIDTALNWRKSHPGGYGR